MITETEIDLRLLAAVREAMGESADGAPQLPKDKTHADIGALLRQIRATVDDLIAIRVREFGTLLQDEEGELMTIKNSLDWLLSDIRESRPKTRIA